MIYPKNSNEPKAKKIWRLYQYYVKTMHHRPAPIYGFPPSHLRLLRIAINYKIENIAPTEKFNELCNYYKYKDESALGYDRMFWGWIGKVEIANQNKCDCLFIESHLRKIA